MFRRKTAINKLLPYLQEYGFKKTAQRSLHVLNRTRRRTIYALKRAVSRQRPYRKPKLTSTIREEILNFKHQPKISVLLPVYNVDPRWLKLAINSVKKQWYENWEICLVDDASTKSETVAYLEKIDDKRIAKIKIKRLSKNLHISGASNEAAKLATGEYLALLDHDDEITPDALYEVVKAINRYGAEFIYSDETNITTRGVLEYPHFKPDLSHEMILSQNYICHLSVMKKSLFDKVGGFELGLEGAQDHDLILKVLEETEKVYHIPKILYFWRIIPDSTAGNYTNKEYVQEAGRRAIENAIAREEGEDLGAEVVTGTRHGTYRVKYPIQGNPLISVIIPFKDRPALLKRCVESILTKSTYPHFEILGMSNQSEEKETFAEMERLSSLDKRVSFYEHNTPFNYSEINNYAVNNYAKGEYLLLLNNDIEIITEEWLENMLMFAQKEGVGAVGAKLYFPNDTIQHAGVIVGLGGVAGHSHKESRRDSYGYFGRLVINQNVSAVTAACLMISREKYQEVGGLDEENLKIAFNDVDFCLRLRERGYRNVFTPYAEAYHYESISRGYAYKDPEKERRESREVEFCKKRHAEILREGDPYYNPNLTLHREDFSIKRS